MFEVERPWNLEDPRKGMVFAQRKPHREGRAHEMAMDQIGFNGCDKAAKPLENTGPLPRCPHGKAHLIGMNYDAGVAVPRNEWAASW
jgi:hypothetical protein